MNDQVSGWLVIGTLLVFVAVNSFVTGPIDDRIKSVIAPYVMLPVGILVLVRGLVALASLRTRYRRWAWGLSYLGMTWGVCFLFLWVAAPIREKDIQLVVSGWPQLVAGAALLGLGFLLRWVAKRR